MTALLASVALLLGSAGAGQAATVPPPALSTEQRVAADRLLEATGAPGRREALVDDVVDRVMMFTRPACAVARGTAGQAAACAAQTKLGRALEARVTAAKPELLAAIGEIQERAYASRLSISEMEAVTAFARTTAGSRFFAAAQTAAAEAGQAANLLVASRVTAILDQLQAEQPQPDTVVEPDR